MYMVNKVGEFLNLDTNHIIKPYKGVNGYFMITFKINNKESKILIHRVASSTFLINPNFEVYKIVNHKDHNPLNTNLSNLEWTTSCENNNKSNGNLKKMNENKYMEYIALNDDGSEAFRITRLNNRGYSADAITTAIKSNYKYKGYKWKKSRLSKKEQLLIHIGYSGNINDYEWEEHPLYPEFFVCKSMGFVKHLGRLICSLDKYGYITTSINGKWMFVHRIIMEAELGRKLEENEVVDHIDNDSTNNKISNLRLTTQLGNMNNEITVSKLSTKIILTDLYGDFIMYDTAQKISSFIGEEFNFDLSSLLNNNFHGSRGKEGANTYICFKFGELDQLYNRLKKVIYVLKNDKLIGAYKSRQDAIINKCIPGISYENIDKFIEEDNYKNLGVKIITGEESIKMLLSTNHITARDFKPELEILNKKANIVKLVKNISNNLSVCSLKKPMKEFNLFGDFLKEHTIFESASMFKGSSLVSRSKLLTHIGHLWCYSGEENKIIEDMKYVIYKVDENGDLIKGFTDILRMNKSQIYKNYVNTGMLAPDGFYYQQGIDFIEPDPDNIDLIPKRPILKWTPKNNKDDIS